jgi:hypothetical protein
MNDSPEHVANQFLAYLRDNKTDAKHVFRVASWIGMLALAIDKVKIDWHKATSRQLVFQTHDRTTTRGGRPYINRYKVRYNHTVGGRGGLEIVEIGTSQGQPEIGVVAAFSTLYDVERFYQLCSQRGWDFPMVLAAYHGSASRRAAQAQTQAAAVIP